MSELDTEQKIEVYGARVHNLKNIDVEIPHKSLAVITGLSGSGKSSLAFDTIYAEGQRRYVETFSAYSRNYLCNLERPDVDKISGLSPVISIDQKTTNKNPRSTVGTTTEIYDFLRLLFARAGEAYSYNTGKPMVKYTDEQIIDSILKQHNGHKVYLLAPKVRNRKGNYKELFETIRKRGYLHMRIDGQITEVTHGMSVDRYRNHTIELVVDRLVVSDKDRERLLQSVDQTMKQGDGMMMIHDATTLQQTHFSRRLMCPDSGLSYSDPAPHDFSFNSPQGACPRCKGLGYVNQADRHKIFPNPELSIREGGIAPLGKFRSNLIFWQIDALVQNHGHTLDTPIKDFDEHLINDLIDGYSERLRIPAAITRTSNDMFSQFEGIAKYIQQMATDEASPAIQKWVESFSIAATCPKCHGARLNQTALHYRIAGKNIAELADMELDVLYDWLLHVEEKLSDKQQRIAAEILKEIRTRLKFLLDVGLEYLSLSRASASLSGGENQRIRLATQIGSQLVNVLYILDEPSIGLHQRDNQRLIHSLKELRDLGNTVIVVEHDQDMMEQADYIIDIGPRAGRKGGEVVFQGSYADMLKSDTLTSRYLQNRTRIEIPAQRRTGSGQHLKLLGASGNNLQDFNLDIPLGTLVLVTGVSGSGKSTLINDTLYPILSQHFYRSQQVPLPYRSIEGIEEIDKVVCVDQSPIGRTPRSNPATYTNVFNDIRSLFVALPEAKIRGYKPGRFSFNVKGGRCEECGGNGYKTIAMNFLPNVLVPCEKCHGKRYARETLEVRYRGKTIADVLDMTINQAVEFFENLPAIKNKLSVLQDVGLGYIKLGQPSTTLSGGESQRVKLATELSRRDTGRTLYILDEPTTGLHFEDIRALLLVLNKLVDKGNTVVVIEHNMDVIKCADWIIDIGPDGGRHGGQLLFAGTPEQMGRCDKSHTAPFLAKILHTAT